MQKRRVFPLSWSELERLTKLYGNPVSFLRGLSTDACDALRSPASLLGQGEPQADRLIFLECIGAEVAQAYTAEWADLAGRALEPNIFYEPGFALNAAKHIPNLGKPDFLFCWQSEVADVRGRLLGVWPLLLPRSGFSGLARSWSHDYGCSCAPLLDRAAADLVLERMLLWVGENHRHLSAVATPQLLANNPVLRRHERACAALRARVRSRRAIRPGGARRHFGGSAPATSSPPKSARNSSANCGVCATWAPSLFTRQATATISMNRSRPSCASKTGAGRSERRRFSQGCGFGDFPESHGPRHLGVKASAGFTGFRSTRR